MKNLNKFFVGVATLVLLTACAQKISAEKFQAKIDALEEHQYQEATIKYVSDMVGTGTSEATTEKKNYSVKFTWNADTQSWGTEDTEHALDAQYLMCIKGMKVSEMEERPDIIPEQIDYKVTYYSDFSVVTSVNGSYSGEQEVLGVKVNAEYKYNKCTTKVKFDKYGYVILMDDKIDSSVKMSSSGYTAEGTQKGTRKVTVSYK